MNTILLHLNPYRDEKLLAKLPEDYLHSSATYYYTGEQNIYALINHMQLQDIDLTTQNLRRKN